MAHDNRSSALAEHEPAPDAALPAPQPAQPRRKPGTLFDGLLIGAAVVSLIVMTVAWVGVDTDKKWAEARSVLEATRAEIERRLIDDRNEWQASRERRIRQLEAERPDGSDPAALREWREQLNDQRTRTYSRDVRQVLDLNNGDLVLLSLQWQGTLRYFRRGDFRFFAGGNRVSAASGQTYFIEVVGDPAEAGSPASPEGVLRIYADGTVEGPLPPTQATKDY